MLRRFQIEDDASPGWAWDTCRTWIVPGREFWRRGNCLVDPVHSVMCAKGDRNEKGVVQHN